MDDLDPNAPTLKDPWLAGPDDPTIQIDGAATQPTYWPTPPFDNTWHDFKQWLTESAIGQFSLVAVVWALLLGVPCFLLWQLAIFSGIDPNHGWGETAFVGALLCYFNDLILLPSSGDTIPDEMEHQPGIPAWLSYSWPVFVLVGEFIFCGLLWWVAMRV